MKIFLYILLFYFSIINCASSAQLDSLFGKIPQVNAKEAKAIQSAVEASKTSESEALKILLEASKNEWAGAAIFFNLGNSYYRNGDYLEAVDSYKKAIEKEANFFMAYKNMGASYFLLNDKANAVTAYTKALSLCGGADADILLRLASFRRELGDFSSALSLCNQALIYASDNTYAKKLKATLLCETGAYSECSNFVELLLQDTPKSPELWKLLGKSRSFCGDKVKAIAAFEASVKFGAKETGVFLALGDLYFSLGAFDSAIAYYKQAMELNKINDSEIFNKRLTKLLSAISLDGDYKKALELSSSISEKFKDSDFYLSIARAYYGLEDYSNADSSFSKSIQFDSENNVALFEYAKFLEKQARYREAESLFRKLIFTEAYCESASLGLVNCAIERGDYKNALMIAKDFLLKRKSVAMERCALIIENYLKRENSIK